MMSVCRNASPYSDRNASSGAFIQPYLLNECLQQTIFQWIPCAIYCFCLLWELRQLLKIRQSEQYARRKSWAEKFGCRAIALVFPTLSIVCYYSLLLFESTEKMPSLRASLIAASFLVLLTVLLSMIYVSHVLERRRLAQCSISVWVCLLSLLIFGFFELIGSIWAIITYFKTVSGISLQEVSRKIIFCFYYFSLFVAFVVHSRSSTTVKESEQVNESDQPAWPEKQYSLFGRLYFSWFSDIMWKGFKRAIELNEMFQVADQDQADYISDYFSKCLDREFRVAVQENKFVQVNHASGAGASQSDDEAYSSSSSSPSVLRVIVKSFGSYCLTASVLKLSCDMLVFADPYFVQLMVAFSTDFSQPLWHGLIYVLLMTLLLLLRTQLLQQYFYTMNRAGVRLRTAFVSSVYRKSLKMTSEARKRMTTGEIVNLMSVDAVRFKDAAPYIQMVWSGPLQIIVALIYMYKIVGNAVFAGVVVMAFVLVVNLFACECMEKLNVKQMKEKDSRMKLLSEILGAIKVIKLYAWEMAFQRRIETLRNKELRYIKRASYVNAVIQFSWSCSQSAVCLAVFYFYDGPLTASLVFAVVTLTAIIEFPLSVLPAVLSDLAMLRVTLKRLNAFFASQELSEFCLENSANKANGCQPTVSKNVAICLNNASFTWESDLPCVLSNINLVIPSGSLVAVVGRVGSGKSSLLSSLCGELHRTDGAVYLNGSVAYASQQAWIQNLTVRDNIVFASSYKKEWYDSVVEACALQSDFQILTNGDMTEIGERGINLSGGQKQRISLARAVYQSSDIYFLDDPLSAVDIHVGKHIFDKVLGPSGLLKFKTRILVTHGLSFLPSCDLIVVMKDGFVEETGNFHDLVEKDGAFAEIVQQYFNEGLSDEEMGELRESVTDLRKFEINRKMEAPSIVSNTVSVSKESVSKNNAIKRPVSIESVPAGVDEEEEDEDSAMLVAGEEVRVGKVSWTVYLKYLQASGPLLLCYVFCVMLTQAGVLGAHIWLQIWSDSAEPSLIHNLTTNCTNQPISVSHGLMTYSLFALFQLFFVGGSAFCFSRFQTRAGKLLHARLFNGLLRSPIQFFDTTPSGRILNRCGKDINTVDVQIPNHIDQVVCFMFVLSSAVFGVVYATPYFTLALLVGALVYYALQRFYVTSSRQFRRLEAVTRSPVYSHFQETLNGVATIRAFRQQQRFFAKSCRLLDINNSFQMGLIVANRWVGVRLDLISLFCVLVSVAIVVVLRDYGVSPGVTGLAISSVLTITDLFSWGVQQTSALETEIVAMERILEYCDAPAEADWVRCNKTVPIDWPVKGDIDFRDYSMRYRPGLPLVIRNLTCAINAGEKIGIVGRTGAGKSSLTLALFRLVEPADGRVFIDRVDLSTMGLHEIRRNLTIIPQEPVLFSGTLRSNIDPFNRHTDEELYKALELSHLQDFVFSLPDGLQHQIGEGGSNVSVGQRQLMCLARAVLRKSKILILDEATAAVDVETDSYVQETIREHFKQCTVLTIAHRINTVIDYDRIMVFESGILMEFDSPDNLMSNENSLFAKLVYDTNFRS